MNRTSHMLGFATGAMIWLPIVAAILGNFLPEASVSLFWQSFAAGFICVPAVIGAFVLVVWLTGAGL